MDKDAWIRKLTSRKFWAAIAAFVVGLMTYIKNPGGDPTALIMSFGAVIAYIVAEGMADAAGAHADQSITYYQADDWSEPEEKPPEE